MRGGPGGSVAVNEGQNKDQSTEEHGNWSHDELDTHFALLKPTGLIFVKVIFDSRVLSIVTSRATNG